MIFSNNLSCVQHVADRMEQLEEPFRRQDTTRHEHATRRVPRISCRDAKILGVMHTVQIRRSVRDARACSPQISERKNYHVDAAFILKLFREDPSRLRYEVTQQCNKARGPLAAGPCHIPLVFFLFTLLSYTRHPDIQNQCFMMVGVTCCASRLLFAYPLLASTSDLLPLLDNNYPSYGVQFFSSGGCSACEALAGCELSCFGLSLLHSHEQRASEGEHPLETISNRFRLEAPRQVCVLLILSRVVYLTLPILCQPNPQQKQID